MYYFSTGVSSYLASSDELERAQRSAQVGNVGLEIVQSVGNAGLDLRRGGPRGAVGSDLVDCGTGHLDGLDVLCWVVVYRGKERSGRKSSVEVKFGVC